MAIRLTELIGDDRRATAGGEYHLTSVFTIVTWFVAVGTGGAAGPVGPFVIIVSSFAGSARSGYQCSLYFSGSSAMKSDTLASIQFRMRAA
jgi:hypothetical protein